MSTNILLNEHDASLDLEKFGKIPKIIPAFAALRDEAGVTTWHG